jgi:hypothetical protein
MKDIRVWLETLPGNHARTLLRNSSKGPDSPVHWAHHHPLNRFPLTVVTQESMSELLNGVIQIFRVQFASPKVGVKLGTHWRQLHHSEKRRTEWDKNSDEKWTKDLLERMLNGEGNKRLSH